MTDPEPLTDEATMTAALQPFGWTCGPEFWERYYQDAWVFNLANAVERLAASVEQVHRERDAAEATLLHVLGVPDEDWQIEMWPEEYEGWVGQLKVTCICQNEGTCWCCDPLQLSAAEVAAIRAAHPGRNQP